MLFTKINPVLGRRTMLHRKHRLNGLDSRPVQQMLIIENLSQPQAELSYFIVSGKALHLSHKSLILLLPRDIKLRIIRRVRARH